MWITSILSYKSVKIEVKCDIMVCRSVKIHRISLYRINAQNGGIMKVLLINGSPKANGCTFTALSEVSNALESEGIETTIFHIGNDYIHGCVGCGGCKKLGKCVFDDRLNEVIELAKEADGFVFGSPVYYASPNGAMISFLDRMFTAVPNLSHKPGAVVVSARRAGTTASIDVLQKYFTIRNMPLVSSSYWPMVHGSSPEDVAKDLEGLQIMRGIGRNMAWLLKCINAGKEAGIDTPVPETPVKTNFIR